MPSLNHTWTEKGDYFSSDAHDLSVNGALNALGGNDEIYIFRENLWVGAVVSPSSSINMGEGDDSIRVHSLDGSTGIYLKEGSQIFMGAGDDTVLISGLWQHGIIATNSPSQNIIIDLGSGDNTFTAAAISEPISLYDVSFSGGDGIDKINALYLSPEITRNDALFLAGTKIDLGNGDDQIFASNGSFTSVSSSVSMGSGNDILSTNSYLDIINKSEIDMGDGNDIVEGGGYIDFDSSIYMGKGNDTLRGLVSGPIFSNSRGKIFGGEGEDTIEITKPGEYFIELDEQDFWVIKRDGLANVTSLRDFELISGPTGSAIDLRQGKYTLDDQNRLTYESVNLYHPSDIQLTSLFFNENLAGGSVVATLSSTDPDTGDTHAYALVTGTGDTDNSAFTIDGDQLKIIDSPDVETKSSYSVRLQTTDAGGLTFEKSFTLTVNDLEEYVQDLSQVKELGTVSNVDFETPIDIDGTVYESGILGTSGKDKVAGTSSDEIIFGGKSKDHLTGEEGADAFVFNTPNAFGGRELDLIKDFDSNEGDVLVLGKSQFEGLEVVSFVSVTGKKAMKTESKKGTSYIIYETTRGFVAYDSNGAGRGFGEGGVFTRIVNAPSLTSSDFVVME